MGPVEVSQAAKQIWRFGSQLSRGVWGSPAIFDVIPTTLPTGPAGDLQPHDNAALPRATSLTRCWKPSRDRVVAPPRRATAVVDC